MISCGPRGAFLFMAWLGIKVLPQEESVDSDGNLKVSKNINSSAFCFLPGGNVGNVVSGLTLIWS